MSVLSGRDLKRFYEVSAGFGKKATVRALNGVSFDLEAHKTLAVVGESGCGKSTLARLLTFIESPTAGSLTLDGVDVTNIRGQALKRQREQIQMVFQDPYGSLNPRKTIGNILTEPLVINRQMSKSEQTDRAAEMLVRVGLRKEHIRRFPHMFSGGQRQRIAIARAMMLSPKVIVADEPVSALDVSIQAQVLNLMMDLQEETGVAMMFISHGLSVVQHIADQVLVMYFGHPVELADKATLFENPKHPYTKVLLSATPFVDTNRRAEPIKITGEIPSPLNPPSGCAFHKRCPLANKRCEQETPQMVSQPDGSRVSCFAVEEGRNA